MLSRAEIISLLSEEDLSKLCKEAYRVKLEEIGNKVSLRALIEWSNVCSKNCFYCGIRHGNNIVSRYRMTEDEIIRLVEKARLEGYGNVVLQSGEIESESNALFVERVLKKIASTCGPSFGITLSLGEQSEDVYKRWRQAGAHRYLLRIETSDRKLYEKIHPPQCSYERRRECIRSLSRLGYQVGTGVMCALPGQTIESLADDICFFADENVDMIGMGPYIPHEETPMGRGVVLTESERRERFELALRMIAVTRIHLRNVNIAAATALEALDERGREKGILSGANVIMPNVTDSKYGELYSLYSDKPLPKDDAGEGVSSLASALEAIGETLLLRERGDSPHYKTKGISA